MGLNLYLKGSQILPRANIHKKEKSREDLRAYPRRMPPSVYHLPKTPKNPECSNIPLILNVSDYLENKIKMDSVNKQNAIRVLKRQNIYNTQSNNSNQTQSTTVTQNLNTVCKLTTLDNNNNINNIDNINRNSNNNTISYKNINNNNNNNNISQSDSRKLITSFSSTTMYRLNKKRAERNERRNVLYAKRHTSCGPRLIVHVDDETTINSENDTNNSKKEIECIGNRYGVDILSVGDWDSLNHLTNNSSSSSSRNQSLENIHKTKSSSNINFTQNSIKLNGGGRLASLAKSSERNILVTKNKNHAYKYHQQGNEYNNNKNKNPVMSSLSARDTVGGNKNHFCSHFFAVGMSLRAWRMKYNKLIKPQKDNQQKQTNSFIHACIVPSTVKNQLPSNAINQRKNIIPISTLLTLETNRHAGRKTLNKSPKLVEKIKNEK